MKVVEKQIAAVQKALDLHHIGGWWTWLVEQPQVEAVWDDDPTIGAFEQGVVLAGICADRDVKTIYATRVEYRGMRGTVFFGCQVKELQQLVRQAVNGGNDG